MLKTIEELTTEKKTKAIDLFCRAKHYQDEIPERDEEGRVKLDDESKQFKIQYSATSGTATIRKARLRLRPISSDINEDI